MKDYPSIPKLADEYIGRNCIVFKKYDGSQIRCEYSKKKGWHKFGTKRRLFDKTDKDFGIAVDLFHNNFAEPINKILEDRKIDNAMAFLEFIGPNSFAGMHEANDPKELVLFDVNFHKKGIIGPKEFVEIFSHLRSAEVLYEGVLTEDLVKDIRESKYPVDEGVICKGGSGHNLWQCKIKTWEYLKKIQKYFGSSYGQYWE
jgi:hypothetical protein